MRKSDLVQANNKGTDQTSLSNLTGVIVIYLFDSILAIVGLLLIEDSNWSR